MSDRVKTFCEGVHGKLSALESRMESLKLNSGLTWHHLQEKLDEVRARGEARQLYINQSRAKLTKWRDDNQARFSNTIECEKENRDARKLAEHAQRTEELATLSIEVAVASVDEAEQMILEAISARLDAESAGGNDNDDDLCSDLLDLPEITLSS